jgi:tRNA threonylcarbamoyl adenosine modification protein (Sua5/YciO/YrdC/YwlC family)
MKLECHLVNPSPRVIHRAVKVLEQGGVIVYPTDTIYGLGCDLFNKYAIGRVYRIKQIPKFHPMSFVCADFKDLSRYAKVDTPAYKIMKKYLPGPYTFILNATGEVPRMMLTKRKTVGIRIPDNEVCRQLVTELGRPIISTSVPESKVEFPNHPDFIEENLGKEVDLILDGGILVQGASTVIDLTEDIPQVIREGSGDVSWIAAYY